MKKMFVFPFLVLIANVLFGQESLEYYKKGVELFKEQRFKEADSIFSLAADKMNKSSQYLGANIYYDRGTTRLLLTDTLGFCKDMKTSATSFHDKEAEKNYKQFCIKYNKNANRFYHQGVQQFNVKNYKASDSLLTLSIETHEFVENVFLRGIVRLYMLDTIGFCRDMREISDINDNANQNFKKICKTSEIAEILQNESEEEVFIVVEVMPKFKGKSKDAFRYFIQQNLEYPAEAARRGIEGQVFVQFVVGKNGEVKNAKVVKSAGKYLDKEALRVVNLSPKWSPGLQRNKPVNVRFTFPIVFELNRN